jgi:transcriptional regulator with XRE-family HTH domain
MNKTKAQQLGDYLRKHREAKGLSQRRLAGLSGLNQPTVIRIERGDFLSPGPDKLKALAKALDLPLTDVWSMAGYGLDSELPSPMPFLRAKYRDLPEDEMDSLTADVADVLRQHGIDPDGRPVSDEDENVNEQANH